MLARWSVDRASTTLTKTGLALYQKILTLSIYFRERARFFDCSQSTTGIDERNRGARAKSPGGPSHNTPAE